MAAGDRICFYVDKAGLTGHCFVQLLPTAKPGSVGPQDGRLDLVYGKYTEGPNMFFPPGPGQGVGTIRSDARRRWDQRICFPVTVAQYNAAAAKIRGKIGVAGQGVSPSPYNLATNNCVDWMSAVAAAAGQALPAKSGLKSAGVSSPGQFGKALKGAGPFGAGTVETNPDPNLGADGNAIALNTPRDFDAEVVAMVSHNDPTALAMATGLSLHQVDLGSFTTTVAGGLTVVLANTDPQYAIISVDWGDASDPEGQSLSYGHVYGGLGTYAGSAAVVNSGEIDVYRFLISVNGGGPIDNLVNITVPTPTPAVGSNPGFEDPPPPEDQNDVTEAKHSTWGHVKTIYR